MAAERAPAAMTAPAQAAPAFAAPAAIAPATLVHTPSPTPAPALAPAALPAPATDEATKALAICDAERRQWRAPIDACTKAFEAAPSANGALVLAHAYWSRADATRTGEWASKALALGSTDPDVQVLLGHVAREEGRTDAAIAAYRRYLRRAPHGWHAPKVRAALRELTPPEPADEAANATN
jgi:hypothetical protein